MNTEQRLSNLFIAGSRVLFISPHVDHLEQLQSFNATLINEFRSRALNVINGPEGNAPLEPHWTLFKSSVAQRARWKGLERDEIKILKQRRLPDKLLELKDGSDLTSLLEGIIQPVRVLCLHEVM